MDAVPIYSLEFEKPLRDLRARLDSLRQSAAGPEGTGLAEIIAAAERALAEAEVETYSKLTPWQRVQIARHPRRPYALDYIGEIFTGFQELHGDRQFRDDRALIGGTAMFEGAPVMVIAQQKGRDTKENIERNFGMPSPEGYRKALRLMRLAEKFSMPVICFIDTPGAYPGVESEERHVSEAIAVNLREMALLRTPTVAVVAGEGGSGGALGIGVADRVLIFENSYYSVISPEGCAAILWKDRAAASLAAEALKLTAADLAGAGIVDEVIAEARGGAHNDPQAAAQALKGVLRKHLASLRVLDLDKLVELRYERYRHMGDFIER